jgi:hypothetical protein
MSTVRCAFPLHMSAALSTLVVLAPFTLAQTLAKTGTGFVHQLVAIVLASVRKHKPPETTKGPRIHLLICSESSIRYNKPFDAMLPSQSGKNAHQCYDAFRNKDRTNSAHNLPVDSISETGRFKNPKSFVHHPK